MSLYVNMLKGSSYKLQLYHTYQNVATQNSVVVKTTLTETKETKTIRDRNRVETITLKKFSSDFKLVIEV